MRYLSPLNLADATLRDQLHNLGNEFHGHLDCRVRCGLKGVLVFRGRLFVRLGLVVAEHLAHAGFVPTFG